MHPNRDLPMPQQIRPRFRLRTLFALMLIAAFTARYWEGVLQFTVRFALDFWWFTYVVLFFTALTLGRRWLSKALPQPASLLQRAVVWMLLAAAGAWLAVVLWSYCLWTAFPAVLPATPRPLPYPDSLLFAIHDWFDARDPAPLGTFKIHGEYFAVVGVLQAGLASGWTLVGLALGVVLEQTPGGRSISHLLPKLGQAIRTRLAKLAEGRGARLC